MYTRAWQIYWFADTAGWYRPNTDISVSAYMFSDMCKNKDCFYGWKKYLDQWFNGAIL